MDTERHPEFVQSLERGLAVIKAFSRERPAMTLSEVAKATGLTRAAARRFLLTLAELGYVGCNEREFYLRPRVLELGYAYLSSLKLSDIVEPHMEALVEQVHESSSVSVLDGTEIVYVARVPTKRIMTIALSVGTRLPAYATSMGRVLLADLPPAKLDEYFATAKLTRLTARTVVEPERLRAILSQVRCEGWALVDQELEDGLRSIAVPLRDDSQRAIAALNVSVHAARVSLGELRDRFLPLLRAAAAQINAELAARH